MNHKKIVLTLIAVTVVGVVAIAAYTIFFQITENTPQTSSTKKTAVVAPSVQQQSDVLKQKATSQSSDQATKAQAVEELKQKSQNDPNEQNRKEYSRALIEVYVETGAYDDALQAATSTDEQDTSALSAATVASVYRAKKDYTNAAKYYGIAADRSEKPTSPTEKSDYTDYKNMQQKMLDGGE